MLNRKFVYFSTFPFSSSKISLQILNWKNWSPNIWAEKLQFAQHIKLVVGKMGILGKTGYTLVMMISPHYHDDNENDNDDDNDDNDNDDDDDDDDDDNGDERVGGSIPSLS